jgi:hypothetical protein
MPTTPERLAAVVLGLEGAGLMILTGWEIVALVTGDTDSVASSVALIVLTALGALAVVAFAFAVWRGASWGRSGGIVTQLLALAVAIGAMTGPDPQPAFAAAVAVPALVGLLLLFGAARVAARRVRASDHPE